MMKTPMETHDYRIRSATEADLPFIRGMVARLRLDGEDLRPEQFIVVEEGERPGGGQAAFGRGGNGVPEA
jgi:hypothetical protein